jgi:hypothetical protein
MFVGLILTWIKRTDASAPRSRDVPTGATDLPYLLPETSHRLHRRARRSNAATAADALLRRRTGC